MNNDTRYILDDLLSEWHKWAKNFAILGSHGTAPMFNGLVSSRQWDSESDVVDGSLHNSQMAAVDFHIGELMPEHRTAIYINARNLHTGKSVWTSLRLPADQEARQKVVSEARNILINRLTSAGIM
jgi:hypothetical protein